MKETPGIVVKDLAFALNVEGENIMGKSVRDTPVDTGRLKSTGHVKLPQQRRGVVEVVLAYGTNYAIYVHEIVSHRVTSGPVYHKSGKAKFLEDAVKNGAKGFTERVKKQVKASMTRRGVL